MKLDPENVGTDQLRQLWAGAEARLDDAAVQRVANAAESVDRIVASRETVYGVNNGFGPLAHTRKPCDRLASDDRPEIAGPRSRLFGCAARSDRCAPRLAGS